MSLKKTNKNSINLYIKLKSILLQYVGEHLLSIYYMSGILHMS